VLVNQSLIPRLLRAPQAARRIASKTNCCRELRPAKRVCEIMLRSSSTGNPVSQLGLGCAKTKSDLVLMPSGHGETNSAHSFLVRSSFKTRPLVATRHIAGFAPIGDLPWVAGRTAKWTADDSPDRDTPFWVNGAGDAEAAPE
jgi:hypothetical protein